MRIFKNRVSSTGLRLAAVAGLAAMLGACAGMELDRVKDLEPQGSEFQAELYAGYVKLSAREHAEHDYRDSDGFAVKAGSAARGEDVAPADLSERMIAPDKAEEISKARSRLVAVLDGSGRDKAPVIAAHAQINLDCWMQEQEEGHQPDDISECRNAFYGSVVAAEVAMRPPPPPPPEPEPAPEPEPVYATYYVVFFEFDSSELSNSAMQTLDEAAETALAMRPYKIIIRGHTDRAGPDAYNMGLSERRALAVAGYMIEKGAGRFVIDAEGLGESEPIAKTADNVRDGRNRRVEVTLSE